MGDRYEQEADSIAGRVMAMRDAKVAAPTAMPPRISMRAAGGGGNGGGESIAASDATLTGGGSELPTATRGFFESRMGRDLSDVRVHSGDEASALNASIQAKAFTYKNHVWLGAGETATPSFTMAHELAHVMQQTGPGPVAQRVMRADMGDLRISEGIREAKENEQTRRDQSKKDAEAQGRAELPVNMAGRILTDDDIAKAEVASIAIGGKSPDRITPIIWGAVFVLHDTATPIDKSKIADPVRRTRAEELAALGRTSLGEGPAAYALKSGDPVIAHTPMFGPRRPTATEFERGQDVMDKASRETGYRAIWQAAARDVRESAVDQVLSKQGTTGKAAVNERKKAITSLDATSGTVFSAAAWAMEDLCDRVTAKNADAMSSTGKDGAKLTAACSAIGQITLTRQARLSTHTNLEILKEAGSNCRTKGTLVPLTPYTADQMQAVIKVYLKAALEARVFPKITTHFEIDKKAGDHCDPRCFNVTALYEMLRMILGHPKGTTYGITPVYGTTASDNIWWNDTVCGGKHP